MIDKNEMRYWIMAGFKLARLEFIWGAEFPEARQAFEPAKREICSMLQGEAIELDESDYPAFCNSILNYFMRKDAEVFSMLLIGNSIQRACLIDAANGAGKDGMKELSRSSLNAIPDEVAEDKDMLFSVIFLNRRKSFQEICSAVVDVLWTGDEGVRKAGNEKNEDCKDKYIFISYSSKERETAEMIRDALEKSGISCWMAPESIPTGSEYTEAIVDAIENSSGFLLVLSEDSQNSQWVPKELDEAITNCKIIFPIHIDRSSIIKKIHFRLTDSQMIEAYGRLNEALEKVICDIKKVI